MTHILALCPTKLQNLANKHFIVSYRLWPFIIMPTQLQTQAIIHSALQSYRLQHSCFPALYSYKLWNIFALFPCRVTNSSNIFLALVELQTLAIILASILVELQTLTTLPFPYKVRNFGTHIFALQSYILWLSLILPCRVANPGKHLFLLCRVTNSGDFFGAYHVFTIETTLALLSLSLNTNHWLMPHSCDSSI